MSYSKFDSFACSEMRKEQTEEDHTVFVVDCISRALFLEDRFCEELAAVAKVAVRKKIDKPLWGILTLGEISSCGSGTVEFLNKTIVVGALHV